VFDDEIVPGVTSAGISARGHEQACSDTAKPSRLEEEVVGLFDQLQDRLSRYLLSLGLPPPDGEEIIQEVFLALFKHLQQGKPRHSLRAWIFRVAHNLALKQRHRARRNRDSLLQYGGVSAENFFWDREPNPEARFSRQEREARMSSVWEALPEQDKRCLSLRAEGLTYREIAEVLEMSLGAVSISLTRSLKRFARADGR
jgi:RNA polymerase sigma-70 factor (ECF subfamily)